MTSFVTKSFSKEFLENKALNNPVFEELYDQSRWKTSYASVFEYRGEYFEVQWQRGSTEYQDEGIEFFDEDENGDIPCIQVIPQEVLVTKYFPMKKEE